MQEIYLERTPQLNYPQRRCATGEMYTSELKYSYKCMNFVFYLLGLVIFYHMCRNDIEI